MKNNKIFMILMSMLCLQSCAQTSTDNSISDSNFHSENSTNSSSDLSEEYSLQNPVNEVALFAGDIEDDSGTKNYKAYKVKAHVTDTYKISSTEAKVLNVYDLDGNLLKENCFNTTIDLIKNEEYLIEVSCSKPNEEFVLKLQPENNKLVTPYEINATADLSKYTTESVDENPLTPATIDLVQRKGGTYLYSNVPERMPDTVLNSILMENDVLTGECFLTFEHQNATWSNNLYMGYRITNLESYDIYVTVTNVGYQHIGSWLGDTSWKDYYGVSLNVDKSKFKSEKFSYAGQSYTAERWFNDYLHFDEEYTPNPIQPVTYKIPSRQHIYVIGGTTQDSYRNINVNNTANDKVPIGHCINGNVKFNITNGRVLGELCVYDDIKEINSGKAPIQNMRRYGEKDDYGGRIGYSPIHGVIDNNPVWEFNDKTPARYLPVTYKNYYADKLKTSYEPFEEVTDCYYHTVENNHRWLTNLSAQLHHEYCGTDMVDIHTICEGKEIVLSNYIANPAGNIWDFGNWMIEYQENCTFVNKGDKDRKIQFYLNNNSSVFYIFKNLDNEILKTGATANICTGVVPIYEYTIKAHSMETISMQYVLPANTVGSVEHYVKLVD